MFQIYKSHHKRVNLKNIKMHLQQMHLWHYIVAAVFYMSMATSHADVIRNFDLASPPQYTNSNGNSGGGGSGSSGSNGASSSSSSGNISGGSSISNINSVSPSLQSSSATLYTSSSITSALVQAEAPSLETFVSAASTSAFVEPYLDGYATTNVTTQIGTHAYLPCRVKQLGNKAVFIADQRFLALKQPDKFWTLQIKYVQARDAGAYECQVSTEPKVSARVHLQVVVPRTEILGDPDRYVKAGSRVNLRCVVRGALEPPTFIMWYHGTEQLSAESRRHITQIDRNLPEAEGDPHSTVNPQHQQLLHQHPLPQKPTQHAVWF
ncbi:hypothetical protein FF38_02868 [Lucilia cuprina]|uniref:Ig-like domain-containing protein n=1 Tax=Lucilia cuprina TaxID=7375 RepID=A0A0L0CL53_LUCCU|nr:hypothetical protein FF38_02868 [Lucilia cuprina]